jgi:carboxymethylenebutenolidase
MNDDDRTLGEPVPRTALSRRDFVALSVTAGVVAVGGPVSAGAGIAEQNVSVTTPDGTADAVLLHPVTGKHPGVLLWTDAFGLRPTKREMGRRLAAAGYTVLIPNPYYRSKPAAQLDLVQLDFAKPDDRARLMALMGSLGAAGAAERDATAYAAFLDAQPQVDTARKLGVHGYCMGGRLTFRSLGAVPERFGAGASFHGGGLVTAGDDSPHRLIPRMQARLYIGISADDDAKEVGAKETLREAFDAAGLSAEIEVYPDALHGWCVPDMRPRDGKPVYNPVDAERAWGKLVALYAAALRA